MRFEWAVSAGCSLNDRRRDGGTGRDDSDLCVDETAPSSEELELPDGIITALGIGLEGAETIDATGKYVLPGGIDSHVHIAQPSGEGIVMADDFESGAVHTCAFFGCPQREHRCRD